MTAAKADDIVNLAIENKSRGVVGVDICGNPTKGDPDRLGHVIHVPDEIKKEIARRKLSLELCISCNVHAKMINGGFLDHHFGYWRHEDCPIALCTDDVGFFCSPVSNEYLLAAQHFGLSRTDLLDMCIKSAEAIFASEYHKGRIQGMLEVFATRFDSA
ncbi:hypothetical protein N7455_006436 [Penicillium solitum]|uniref:uncharacterized protein n=1 Tax=Penicillium solitum TaxID=60172 RepID=UPI00184B6160|nr:hypothetical protein HAV15_011960 [Penicillium sp. str. \